MSCFRRSCAAATVVVALTLMGCQTIKSDEQVLAEGFEEVVASAGTNEATRFAWLTVKAVSRPQLETFPARAGPHVGAREGRGREDRAGGQWIAQLVSEGGPTATFH